MAIRGSALTLGAEVYAQIRDGILHGELQPGERLRPSQLRQQYNVSVSVVREALTRLAEQKLVIGEPNLGFTVAPLSRKHLDDLVQARAEIECFTFRLSVREGDLAWEAGVISTHRMLERAPERHPDGAVNTEWSAAHASFHAQLLAGCSNEVLVDVCRSLFQSADLYRLWSARGPGQKRDTRAEHAALADAAIARDEELAARLLLEHIQLTGKLAIQNVASLQQ